MLVRGLGFPEKQTVKSELFLTNKGFLENKDITLVEGNKVVTSKKDLAKTF